MDFSESPTDPLGGGGWTLDFSVSQIDPQNAWKTHKNACKSLENTQFSPSRCAFGGSLGTFRGGWTLDFSECPIDPLGGGGWTLDFSESPTDPPGGGGWTLDFSESPTDPLGGGGWTLDFKKERNQVQGGRGYKVTLVLLLGACGASRGVSYWE